MDEPSANIDIENTVKIIELVVRLSKELNQSFIIATHDSAVVKACTVS